MTGAALLLFALSAFAPGGDAVTVAGTGAAASTGDGGPAVAAAVHDPFGVAVGPHGGLFVCEVGGRRVRRIDPATGVIRTVVGTGEPGSGGDGGPAAAATLIEPYEIAFDPAGRWLIVDMAAHVVRRVDPRTGLIETVAGTGGAGFSGDGGPATAARLNRPHSVCVTPDGVLWICDIGNHRVRAVDPTTGMIRTACGDGTQRPTPAGAPFAPGTPLAGPRALAVDPATGDLILALREGNAVYRVAGRPGSRTLRRIVGTGRKGFAGDGGPALDATLTGPKGVAVAANGDVLIADTENHAVRRLDVRTGTLRTVLGRGAGGATLSRPHGVAVGPDGSVLVGDSGNHRVLRLPPAAD